MPQSLYSEIGSLAPDILIADGSVGFLLKGSTLKSGQGVLKRGSVLGIIKTAGVTVTAETNTGGGTCTGAATGKNAKVGSYVLKCIAVALNAGTFSVIDPNGNRLADAVVGAAYLNEIGFTLNDAETDFAVGDSFTLAVAAGSGLAKLVDKAAADGSNIADSILADDVDTTADADAQVYTSGLFNRKALIFAANNTAADHELRLREIGIFLKDNIAY